MSLAVFVYAVCVCSNLARLKLIGIESAEKITIASTTIVRNSACMIVLRKYVPKLPTFVLLMFCRMLATCTSFESAYTLAMNKTACITNA
jgi:hypothetical protein